MRVIALANQKGGVAKTTSVLNIGAGLMREGKRVLLIDLDPQSNLTESCGWNPEDLEISTHDVLVENVSLRDVIHNVEDNLDLAPANDDLIGTEVDLLDFDDKNFRLRQALKRIRGYDYVLLDCPPSLGQITVNALCAAKEVFIPLQAEFLALRGLKKLLTTIDGVKAHSNKNLKFSGVFATRFSARKNLNLGVVNQLREHFGSKLFNTPIRDNVALAEASAAGMHIFQFRNSSNGANDYRDLCGEIMAMEGK